MSETNRLRDIMIRVRACERKAHNCAGFGDVHSLRIAYGWVRKQITEMQEAVDWTVRSRKPWDLVDVAFLADYDECVIAASLVEKLFKRKGWDL